MTEIKKATEGIEKRRMAIVPLERGIAVGAIPTTILLVASAAVVAKTFPLVQRAPQVVRRPVSTTITDCDARPR
jgi:hypothetical protein